MRLLLAQDALLLDPTPLTADRLRRNPKFKMRLRRHVTGDGPGGLLLLRMPGNDGDFRTLVGRLTDVAEALGCDLEVSPKLDASFNAMRELAEE